MKSYLTAYNNRKKIRKILIKNRVLWWYEIFSWKKHSFYVAKHCPEYFDPNKFNWKEHSWFVAEFCPQHLDTDKYNWKRDSWAITCYCPQHFNSNKFNWEAYSCTLIEFCPEKLDINKANLENILKSFPEYYNMSLKEIKHSVLINKI